MDTLLDSGKYSDLRLTCQERTWNVHRAVICTASPVFAAMADGEFKAQSGVIDLPADEPEIVEVMLRFLYQGKYNDARPTAALVRGHAGSDPDGRGGLKFSPSMRLREEAMVVNVKVTLLAEEPIASLFLEAKEEVDMNWELGWNETLERKKRLWWKENSKWEEKLE
ncbi:hypothetical protein V500_07006 [Pseudogymnoascus sp. VKM F-4518 (FW-2643)]|nr:hypothetical protein V500_07006 [Pseudogymnoascus sp. VKM F-4518 (FW-2643)]